VKELVKRCDIVLVVGSKTSSNSNRLREVAANAGVLSYLIDSSEDVEPAWLANANKVGVTAGASAPEILVQEVVTRLCDLGAKSVITLEGVVENVLFQVPKELSAS